MVTGGLGRDPLVTTTGTASPGATPSGTMMLIW
jgi:hypothetical protein